MERNSISLNLGDIIKLTSPSNDNLHNKIFLITYIDKSKIEIRDEFNIELLNIIDSEFSDKSIKGIEILQRSERKGYAEINGLVEGKWINVYFKGDVPFVIVGKIVSKEKDMIEIKLHPEESYIYLDFGYSGLKDEYNIEKIELRESPKTLTSSQINDVNLNDYEKINNDEEEKDEDKENEGKDYSSNLSVNDGINENKNVEDEDVNIENKEIPYDELLEDDTLGEDLGFAETISKVPQKEMRYGLKVQIEDLVGNMINNIEFKKRTPKAQKNIEIFVERITLLRNDFSKFDENGNIKNIFKKFNKNIISENILENKLTQPIWFYYGNVMKDKLYNSSTNGEGMFIESNIIDDINNYKIYNREYQTTKENKFQSDIDDVLNPFEPSNDEMLFSIFNSKNDINTISNNTGNLSKNDVLGNTIYNLTQKHLSGETITFDSYATLPFKLYSLQDVRNPNINILTKLIESNKRKLINEIFSDTENSITFKGTKKINNKNLDKYIHHIRSKKQQEDLKELLERDLPEISEVIYFNYLIKNGKRALSVKKIIDDLSKYTINSDNIDYDSYISIKNIVYSLKRDFFSFFDKKANRLYNSLSSINQNSYYDLFEKYTFYNYLFDKRSGPEKENELLTDLLKKTYLKEPVRNQLLQSENVINNGNRDIIEVDEKWEKTYVKSNPNATKKDIQDAYVLFKDKGIISSPEDIEKYYSEKNNDFIERKFSNSSFITYVKDLDNLQFLTDVISFGNASLINDNFESMMDNYKTYLSSLNNNENKVNTNNVNYNSGKCDINIELSKKYSTEEELEKDNNKDIEYDNEYDDTYYDAIHIYKEEKERMTKEQFETFLAEKMKEVHELDQDASVKMAKIIINGKKMVEDGDYCLLEIYDDELVSIRIYKRINNRWVFDEESTSQHKNNFSLLLDGNKCKQTIDCGYDGLLENINNDCLSTREKREKLNKNIVDKMIIEFKHVYAKKESELKLLIAKSEEKIRKKRFLINKNIYKYSENNNRISNFYNFQDMSIVSPLHSLRDEILNIEDFNEKQKSIVKFVNTRLRKPNINKFETISENKYMLYCIETNQAILPIFLYELANTFLSGKNYARELERIKNVQGVLSDDGSFWVDEKSGSGYKICDIDFSYDEGYNTEGYKNVSNDVLEPDEPEEDEEIELTEIEMENYEEFRSKMITDLHDDVTKIHFTSPDANDIVEIITSFEIFTNIKFVNKAELVIKIVNFYNRNPNLKSNAEIAKMVLTMSALVINIQLQIFDTASIRYNGSCVPFIFGFPLFNETNMKTIEFVCCVFKEIKYNEQIVSMKNEEIINTLKSYIMRLVKGEFKSDINIFLTEKKSTIVKQLEVKKEQLFNYKMFLPYQGRVNFSSFNPLSTKIKEPFMTYENTLIAKSKIIGLSYHILSEIHNTIAKEELHFISTKIIKINTCCMSTHDNVDMYFRDKNSSYNSFIQQAYEIENMLNITRLNKKSNIYHSNENTRIVIPSTSKSYDEILVNEAVEKYKARYIELNNINEEEEIQTLNKKEMVDGDDDIFQPDKIDVNYIYEKNIIEVNTNDSGNNMSFCDVLQRRMQDRIICQEEEKDEDEKLVQCVREDLTPKFENFIDKLHNTIKDIPCEGSDNIENFESSISKLESYLFNQIQKMKDQITKSLTILIKNKTFKKVSTKFNVFFDKLKNIFLDWSKHKIDSNPLQLINTFKLLIQIINEKSYVNLNRHDSLINSRFVTPAHWGLSYNDKMFLSDFNKKTNVLHEVNSIPKDLFEKISSSMNEHLSWINTISLPKDLKHMEIYIYIYSIFYLLFIIQENIDTLSNVDTKLQSNMFLNTLIQRLFNEFETQTNSYDKIMEKTLRSKEREKDQMTKQLKGMTDDEGEVDEFLKLHKLGKWGRGLGKQLYVYDEKVQDEERQQFIGLEMEENYDISHLGEDGQDLTEED